jgi:Zn-dependent M28 family amino/carboxypeptidase
MKKNLLVLFLMLSFVFSTAAQTVTKKGSPAMKAVETITSDQMKDFLYFLADDAMQGRDTPSAGLDVAANFIAFNLKKWGVKPAGDPGSYFQRMWVVRKSADPAASSLVLNGQTLKYGDDFYGAADDGMANAPLVFGGTGWMHKAKGIDALAGVDVKGKIVILYGGNSPNGLPAGLTFADLQQGKQGVDWATPVANAAMKGAIGIINIASPRIQANWARSSQGGGGGVQIENLRDTPAGAQATLPVVTINQNVVKTLFEGESANPLTNADAKAFALQGSKTANFTIKGKVTKIPTQNVVGMIEGSDPVLKKEMIVMSAHYDHVGVNPNAPGEDKIFNGADDDGSGTTGILAIAEALAKSPKKPKRSVVFLWVAGEEKGLLGSEYFAKFPTVPMKDIITDINIDMIGRSRKADNTDQRDKDLSGENEIYVIGSNMMSTTLGKVTDTVNKSYLNLTYNLKYDDPKDTNRFFFRSDHFNFAVNGVPAVFFFNGVHRDYHQAGDHPDKIDYVRMQKIARTVFLTMWELADLKERPKIDRELPPELRQR